jgi:hypothetical protein
MSGYCTIGQVCSAFPFFRRDQGGSIGDSDIQGWIDDRKARIRSAFLTRGFDPDNPPNPPLTQDQAAFLRALNRDGAIADLGDALQGQNSLQPGEYSVPKAHRESYENVLKEITKAGHDAMFNTGPLGNIARTQDVTPQFLGIAGGATSPCDTPPILQTNVKLYLNQRF